MSSPIYRVSHDFFDIDFFSNFRFMIVDISFCELLITWKKIYYGFVGFSRYGGNDGAAYEMIGSSLMVSLRPCILSSFLWGYMCSSVVVGALVDKHGERRVLAVGASLWSFATLLTPWAANHSTTSLLVEFISAAASAIPRFSLFINSTCAGVSGPIPQTFANLRSLTTVWASDNELTGRIPNFIGNWSRLNTLRFQGNSFQGSIPASFSNLTMLSDLRISDLSNGSSSLNFLRNMASLSTLKKID